MKPINDLRMDSVIRFNRPVSNEADFIIPSRYEVVVGDEKFRFTFQRCDRAKKFSDAAVILSQWGVAFDEGQLTAEKIKNISEISAFSVFAGESDLKVVSIDKVAFYVRDESVEKISVNESVLKAYNDKIHSR